jgi:hypothetical protein
MTRPGFPHSDIPGSQPATGFPRLFAGWPRPSSALAPRHPPYALGEHDPTDALFGCQGASHPGSPNRGVSPGPPGPSVRCLKEFCRTSQYGLFAPPSTSSSGPLLDALRWVIAAQSEDAASERPTWEEVVGNVNGIRERIHRGMADPRLLATSGFMQSNCRLQSEPWSAF